MRSRKPRVRYAAIKEGGCNLGHGAWVFLKSGSGHRNPEFADQWVKTSRVMNIFQDGTGGPAFETKNTIYLPEEGF